MHNRFMLAAAAAFSLGGAHAAESSDLAAIRAQVEEMKKTYEQRIAALEARLAKAEAAPAAPPAAVHGAAPAAAVAGSGGGRFNPDVSLILQGRYLNAKDRGEAGISGFWPAGHDHGGRRRGFSVDHTELVVSANVDPFWRGQAIVSALNGEAEVEEAWFQRIGLGQGFGVKGGRFRSGLGYLNEQHPHQWDFADAPLMYQAMFGSHASYAQDGIQLKWLAPTPFFLEFGAEAGRGAGFPGSDRNKNGNGSGALFAHAGGDVGLAHSWRAGLSYLRTSARDRATHLEDINAVEAEGLFSGRSRTWVADFVWKWAPDGNPKYRNLKLQAEYFSRREDGALSCRDADDPGTCGSGTALGDYRRRQSGWYAQAVYQFTPNWRAGYRYDRLHSGTASLDAAAGGVIDTANPLFAAWRPERQSVMVDYSWSEYSRVRLQLARDESALGLTDNQVTLQYVMSLGAHGAHKF